MLQERAPSCIYKTNYVCVVTVAVTKGEELQTRVGAFVPQLKENGEYVEKQCWPSTGYCWCVDKDGNELPGTRRRGELECPSNEGRGKMYWHCCKPIRYKMWA